MQNPLIEVTFEENTFSLKELESETYKDLCLSITDLFSSKGLPESFKLSYIDDEGDAIILQDELDMKLMMNTELPDGIKITIN